MPSPSKKSGNLIKGQSSLAGYFAGAGLTLAKQAEQSPVKKRASKDEQKKEKRGSEVDPRYSVAEELTEKITIKGHQASPSKPAANRRVVTGDTSSESEETDAEASESAVKMPPSKYFSDKNTGQKKNAIAISDSSSEDEKPRKASNSRSKAGTSSATVQNSKPPTPSKSTGSTSKRKVIKDEDSDDDFEVVNNSAKKPKTSAKASPSTSKNKRTSAKKVEDDYEFDEDEDMADLDDDEYDDDDDEFETTSKKSKAGSTKAKANGKTSPTKGKASPTKKPTTSKSTANVKEEVPAEAPKAEKQPPAWLLAKKRREDGPAMPGSKEIPVGKPNCLAGLTLVFTGELSSLSRDEATDLAKRYGAKVTGSPSSKTSYVIVGTGAGPSKLAKIEKSKIKTLDEDGFLNLIAEKSKGKIELDDATKKKMADEQKKIEQAAKDLQPPKGSVVYDNALWTTKYAPQSMKDLAGNAASIKKLQEWLHDWQSSLRCNFKKPGKNGLNIFRAVLLSGPPGVGKTSAAHIIAKAEGYTPIELNASDVRSKKLIEASLKDTIYNASLDGWKAGGKISGSSNAGGIRLNGRSVLIMDEVDGMSGGDRGGVGAINALIKKTKVPIICICNDSKNPKMKPLEHTTSLLKFQKPDIRQVKQRIMTIAFREKLKFPPEVIEQLIQSAQSDIRLVINMLSTWALSKKTMNFDEGKEFGAANAKPGMHTPFTLYAALSSPGMWAPTNKKTLNDKADYYFQDHSFMPLMVQQNYINHVPQHIASLSGKERDVKLIQTIQRAAESISDGDIIDSMIHSSEQHWSLMPLHGILSTVKPMKYAHGASGGFPMFSSWLGQNSKQQRLMRNAIELQARLRLTTTASRFEVREQYVPYFFPRMIQPLIDADKNDAGEAVEEIIEFMDDYYLTAEDRDVILELGIGANDGEALSKKVPSTVKASFTRKYNSTTHPVAFYKSSEVGAKPKQLAGAPAPDVEEAYDQDDEQGAAESDVEKAASGDEVDISKDKFFKQKNAKGKGKAAAKGKAGKSSK